MAGIDLSVADPKLRGGLEETGIQEVSRANAGMEGAALSESERTQYNARVEAQNKSGNQQLGALAGSIAGSYFGPIGTALGGMLGGMIGGAV